MPERVDPPISRDGSLGDSSDATVSVDATADIGKKAKARQGLARGSTVGRYLLVDEIGHGGMGVVYKAYDPELDRPVALKLVRIEEKLEGTLRERLLREAQALARLSHPNVIAVHDVGTFGKDVFIAMEFVDGQTMRKWLEEKPRTRSEILEVFLAAGAGLAAAHGAGLVHRDFKPDNVIIGRDGRVRVLDFGLARATDLVAAGPETPLPPFSPAALESGSGFTPSGASSSGKLLGSQLTQVGAIVGTPRFMAPEQHLGDAVNEKVDQFAFCVSLYWSLYGMFPFGGSTPEEYRDRVLDGRVVEAPAGTQVPRWVRQVLLRGLAREPAARYPSMDALRAALLADPGMARRRWLSRLSILLVLGSVAGVWRVAHRQQVLACEGAERKLAGVWDDARRASVRAAFQRSGLPYAEAALHSVERLFDDYAQAWTAMHVEACQATLLRKEQSQELLDLRMSCLSDRLGQVKALSDLFATADASIVERSVQSVESLPTLSRCADAAALRAPIPPPADPTTRRRVEELHPRLAQIGALDLAGKYTEGLALATVAAKDAESLRYPPLEAEAQLKLGQLLADHGDFAEATRVLRTSLVLGISGRHDEVAAWAATDLVYSLGLGQERYDEASGWAELARGVIDRLKNKDDILGVFHRRLAALREEQGKLDESLSEAKEALDLELRKYGPEHHRVAVAYRDLGRAYYVSGKNEEALDCYQRSSAIDEKSLGADHPGFARALSGLANVYAAMGQYERAAATNLRALQIYQRLNPDHADIAILCNNMGNELEGLGKLDEALKYYQQALAVTERTRGASRTLVVSQLNIGNVELELGQTQAGLHRLEGALALAERELGTQHYVYGRALTSVGEAHRRLGHLEQAVTLLRRGEAIEEKVFGAKSVELAEPLLSLGRAQLALGDGKNAAPNLERALALYEHQPEGHAKQLAECRSALTQARASR
jgi:serine/threonine protein kinase/tetratricopeptide (TPR) repeat protein